MSYHIRDPGISVPEVICRFVDILELGSAIVGQGAKLQAEINVVFKHSTRYHYATMKLAGGQEVFFFLFFYTVRGNDVC